MEYNPLENVQCQYDINEVYEVVENDYSWKEIEIKNSIKEQINYRSTFGDYDLLVLTITDTIDWFLQTERNDWQGDYYWLGKDNLGNYYYLVQGYGSCSGCDAYEACDTIQKLNDLREDLKRRIIKFESIDEFYNYLTGDMSKGSYYWYDDDFKIFINKLNEMFDWNIKVKEDY